MKVAKTCLAILLILSLAACTTDQILADLNLALQIALEIVPTVMAISPTDAAAIQRISQAASTGLQAVTSAYNAYKKSQASGDLAALEVALDNFKGNLNAVIAAAQVKDPRSVAKVTAWANLIYSVTDAILSAIPQAKATGPKRMTTYVVLPKPEDLKAKWTAIKGQP